MNYPTMFKRFQYRIRQYLLNSLRPGQTHQELLSVIGRAEAIRSDEQRHMLEGIVEFHDTRVREVMIPRSEIKAIDISVPLSSASKIIAESGVTRLPVMDHDLDHILGVIHIWDLVHAQTHQVESSIKALMRPTLTVSELEYISGLLTEMRDSKNHIAMVLDEYGGTAGLVTLSDLLEEIVGSMDEGENQDSIEYTRGEHGLEVQARMHVEDLEDLLSITLPNGDFDTVGGLIITELGRIPVRGERILVGGLDIHVQEADPRRVIRILIKSQPDSK
ncbi:MAG: hemolysin family protein [Mariprofundaceae bacterium]|nr:hemolysin family protein [Mariprofundaceae bacterium]